MGMRKLQLRGVAYSGDTIQHPLQSGAPRPVSFATVSALIWLALTAEDGQHRKTFNVGRVPCHLSFSRVNQLDTTADPICPNCGEKPQTSVNWLQKFTNAVAINSNYSASHPHHTLTVDPTPRQYVSTTKTRASTAGMRPQKLPGEGSSGCG